MNTPPDDASPASNAELGRESASPIVRISTLAKVSILVGVIGIFTCIVPAIGGLLGIVAIIAGTIASRRIQKFPDRYYGLGYAHTGTYCGIGASLLSVAVTIVALVLVHFQGMAGRSICAGNMRMIMQAMNVYGTDNGDVYPLLPFAPYGPANAGVSSDTIKAKDGKEAVKTLEAGSRQDGSVLGSVWILALQEYLSSKSFICDKDPFVTRLPAPLKAAAGSYFITLQATTQISYSFAYPYLPDGTTGKWWKNTVDSTLPICSDMAPMNGTGTPRRNVTPGTVPAEIRSLNSGNHNGDGQNMGFADGHAEFARRPDIGQNNDNVFTMSGAAGPAAFTGSQPGKAPIRILTKDAPYDVVMVPARNLDAGGF